MLVISIPIRSMFGNWFEPKKFELDIPEHIAAKVPSSIESRLFRSISSTGTPLWEQVRAGLTCELENAGIKAKIGTITVSDFRRYFTITPLSEDDFNMLGMHYS